MSKKPKVLKNNNQFKLAARSLILNDAKEVLLVTHAPLEFWYSPGGHVNNGESLLDCAIRETMEETGVSVKLSKLIFVDEWVNEKQDERKVECYFLGYSNTQPSINWIDKGGPILHAKFFSQNELLDLPAVFPTFLLDEFWQLLDNDFTGYNPYRNLSPNLSKSEKT